jgi:hypothetical protein
MATTASTGAADVTAVRALTVMVRAMFPHPSFPDGPYERCAQVIAGAAADDVRWRTQLEQGLRDLDALGGAPFGELAGAARLDLLRGISATEFFEGVRSRVITSLYNDPEVWALLGWEGPSFERGGYRDRGFDDLDWLPDPRIEEAS